MKNICLLVCSISFLFVSCHSQTNREIIQETTRKIIEAIKTQNTSDFKSLIGVSNLSVIGKDEESIENDIKKYNSLFAKYYASKEIPIDITGLFNGLGQMVVRIPLFQNNTDSTDVKSLHLNLYFGPPAIVPLSKMSGYELIRNNSDSTEFTKQQ